MIPTIAANATLSGVQQATLDNPGGWWVLAFIAIASVVGMSAAFYCFTHLMEGE